jgi:cyclopropane fatty-acyl-phospholipid synthase-like methyltransferase
VAHFVAGTADYWQWWAALPEVARSGRPFQHHDVAPDDPYWRRYLTGQFELSRLSAGEVARKLEVPPGDRTLLDVGGGHGWYSAQLCRRHPGLVATVLDLPGSARIGREIIAAAGMSDRVRHRDGDALTADLGGPYDLILCFNLVHHLTPDEIVDLFRRFHDALAPGGSLAVMDGFADPARRASAAGNVLGLFVYLSSGSGAFTPDQLHGWLKTAGFAPPRKVPMRRIPGLALYQSRAL